MRKSQNNANYKTLPKTEPRSTQFAGKLQSDLVTENEHLQAQVTALQLKLAVQTENLAET
jgi:hypothetical protein